MHRSLYKPGAQFATTAIVVAAMTAVLSACAFDTRTNFCEQFGLRCKEGQQCAANEAVCITIGGCGNGTIDKGEICDDGNTVDGEMDDAGVFVVDQCSADCQSNQQCGNGVMDRGERCDLGARNGMPNETCDSSCRIVNDLCGNSVVDQGKDEDCDPGLLDSAACNSNMAGAVSCKTSRCGDGYTNMVADESCDSSGSDTAQCNGRLCTSPSCGDNYVNQAAGEQCDGDGVGG